MELASRLVLYLPLYQSQGYGLLQICRQFLARLNRYQPYLFLACAPVFDYRHLARTGGGAVALQVRHRHSRSGRTVVSSTVDCGFSPTVGGFSVTVV